MEKYDFHGWATKNDLLCSDGRVIRRDAFMHNDGETVPLVWNHDHKDPFRIVGHVLLENHPEGVLAHGKFNDTELGKTAKIYVEHGDIRHLSIYANQLKQQGNNVLHGSIREVSLVLAGANPGACILDVIKHGEEVDPEEGYIYTEEEIELFHADDEDVEHSDEESDEETIQDVFNTLTEKQKNVVYALISQALKGDEEDDEDADDNEDVEHSDEESDGETLQDVFNTLTEKQKNVVYALISQALSDDEDVEHSDEESEEENEEISHSEGGNTTMKQNAFDTNEQVQTNAISHADQMAIIELAKSSAVGSLRAAMEIYAEDHKDTLAHGFENIGELFPDYKDVHPGAPELIERDQSWIGSVLKKAHKSPISRIRTRQADARANELRAKGYNNREEEKALSGNIKLIMRTTDPQTVYRRDELHRDDIIDITDFDVVAYQKTVMKHNMEEEVALAALIGDGRDDLDPDKIHENHIRSVLNDEELYTMHYSVDIEAARNELQGGSTSLHFGENYIFAEAAVTASLYSREKYKGKGTPDMYCDPHFLNVMLLARDLNGRRIYDSKADIAKALNVGEIHTVEQMAGLTRTDKDGNVFKVLAIVVNMGNYQFGCTKGGEVTNIDQFDIDFNKYKYLSETRLSGALTEIQSAIVLEEPVEAEAAG